MEDRQGFFQRSSCVQFLFSLFSSFLLLVSAFQVPLTLAINRGIALPTGFHPSHLLSSSFSSMSSSSSSSSDKQHVDGARTMPGRQIEEDEVLFHLYRNGRSRKDYRKPSTRFMVNLFNSLQRGGTLTGKGKDGPVTDTIRSFSGQNERETRKGKPIVDFQIPYLPRHERLRNAEIRFLRDPTRRPKSRKYKFRIDIKKDGNTVNKYVLHERSVIQLQYDVFDVTEIVGPWINDYHGNISLHVRISKKLQRQTLVASKEMAFQSTSLIVLYLQDREFLKNMYTSFTSDDDEGIQSNEASPDRSSRRKRAIAELLPYSGVPLTSWDLETNSTSRERRDTKKQRRKNRKSRKWFRTARKENCQIHDFEVDFNTIGWGQWIIHPKRFNSRFCFGMCPSPIDAKYNPTNHAMLQALMRMKKPNVAPVPCCVPTKLNPVSMLYFEYDEIVVRHHEDMVADQCGCR